MKLNVELKHCYGIDSLTHEFDFTERNIIAIYASNGVMKTSFTKTFENISKGQKPQDIVHNKDSKYTIIKNHSEKLEPSEIFAIRIDQIDYKNKESISRLLASNEIKKEYDNILSNLLKKKKQLLQELHSLSKVTKKELEIQIQQDFPEHHDFDSILLNMIEKISEYDDSYYRNVIYSDIFNKYTAKLLNHNKLSKEIGDYFNIYNKLLKESPLFDKGFDHINATEIANLLDKKGYFKADHVLSIKQILESDRLLISNHQELLKEIETEKSKILNNDNLTQSFKSIDDLLGSNEGARSIRDCLNKNQEIIIELNNTNLFKKKLWISYVKMNLDLAYAWKNEYMNAKTLLREIHEKSKNELKIWEETIENFNNRFDVPFRLSIQNQEDVILKEDKAILKYTYINHSNGLDQTIPEDKIPEILSRGEMRALFMLHIMFEIILKIKENKFTILIIDDIADSFDYKNKHAIIEYLYDISKNKNFYLIILSHNYDFYRSISLRLDIYNENRFHAVKKQNSNISEIRLVNDSYNRKHPFEVWKDKAKKNNKYIIPLMPFIRELIDFCGIKDENKEILNAILHIKKTSKNITLKDAVQILNEIIYINPEEYPENENMINFIYSEADKILNGSHDYLQLEDKVILSIAIRLKAEEYMIREVDNDMEVSNIKKHQTRKLTEMYKDKFSNTDRDEQILLLDRVNLITPDCIHLNSFMYEPLLDTSFEILKEIYSDVNELYITDALVQQDIQIA